MSYKIRGGGGNSYDVLSTILGFAKDLAPPIALLAIKQYLDTMIVPSSQSSMESSSFSEDMSQTEPQPIMSSPARVQTKSPMKSSPMKSSPVKSSPMKSSPVKSSPTKSSQRRPPAKSQPVVTRGGGKRQST